MSLFTITFDSEEDEEEPNVLPIRKKTRPPPQRSPPKSPPRPPKQIIVDESDHEDDFFAEKSDNEPGEPIPPPPHEPVQVPVRHKFEPRPHSRQPCPIKADIPSFVNDFTRYSISRVKNLTWKGKRIHFQLSQDDKPIYHCKIKQTTGPYFISEGLESHLSAKTHAGAILVTAEQRQFQLRANSIYGDPIVSIQFHQSSLHDFRQAKITFFKQSGLLEGHDLITRQPIDTPNGLQLDWKSRYCMPSIKNLIFSPKGSDISLLYIYKTLKHQITVEQPSSLTPLHALFFGIAAFMCKEPSSL